MQPIYDKEELIQLAEFAEICKRYDDMRNAIKTIVKHGEELSYDERNLLSSAYKSLVCARRTGVTAMLKIKASSKKQDLANKYKDHLVNELKEICYEILNLLDTYLIPKASLPDDVVFYFKMKGDYNRYLAEVDAENASSNALNAYQFALETATSKLESTHPLRLGLALNFSVFYYDILHCNEKAYELSKQTLDEVLPKMSSLSDESSNFAADIIELLKENLSFWTQKETDDSCEEMKDEKNVSSELEKEYCDESANKDF